MLINYSFLVFFSQNRCSIGDSIVYRLVQWTKRLPFYEQLPVHTHTQVSECLANSTIQVKFNHYHTNINIDLLDRMGWVLKFILLFVDSFSINISLTRIGVKLSSLPYLMTDCIGVR